MGSVLALTRSKSNSSAYIGIFFPTSNLSWMSNFCPFPLSKWKNLIPPMCVWERHHQPTAKLAQSIKRDVNLVPRLIERHCVFVRVDDLLDVLLLLYHLIRLCCSALISSISSSDQKWSRWVNTHLTCLRWNLAVSHWWAHEAQQEVTCWAHSCCCCRPVRPSRGCIQQQRTQWTGQSIAPRPSSCPHWGSSNTPS
jgi:hypothetical protein